MPKEKHSWYGTLIIVLLVVIGVIAGIVVWVKYRPAQPVEISLPSGQELRGGIYISGAIANPGFYPMEGGDSIEALIQAAGGTASSADLGQLKLHIPQVGEKERPQKVDLNRAEAWLLEALPEIGKGKAQAIIDYRRENGPFRNASEIVRVKGIGTATYEEIKNLITVAD